MDLNNGQITVGELLSNPKAVALLKRELPMLIGNPMLMRARSMTLNQILAYGKRYITPQKLNSIMSQLRAI